MPSPAAILLLLVASRWLPASGDSLPQIEEVAGPPAAAPVIAVAADGATVLAWEEATELATTGRGVFVRRRSPGPAALWSESAARLDDVPDGARALEPRLAAAGEHVILGWQDGRAGRDDVYVRASPDGGLTWPSLPVRLDSTPEGSSMSSMLAIAGNASGLFAAAWEDARSDTRDIYFRRSTDFGESWGSSEVRLDGGVSPGAVHADAGAPANGASYHPQVAVQDDGSVLVVWWDEARGLSDVIARRSGDRGATWDEPVRLDPGEPGTAASRDAAFAVRGETIAVAWEDEIGGIERETIVRASFDAGRSWGSAARIERPRWASAIENPRVALGRDGRAHVAWVAVPADSPPENTGPTREWKTPTIRPEPAAALFYAAIDCRRDEAGSNERESFALDPVIVPAAAPHSHLAWIGGNETITWIAWVGSRVDPGGLDAAWTTDGGSTWRAVGLSRAQNPDGSFVGVGAIAAATDASGALHLAWLQGRTGRERLLFTRIPNPMAPEDPRD